MNQTVDQKKNWGLDWTMDIENHAALIVNIAIAMIDTSLYNEPTAIHISQHKRQH